MKVVTLECNFNNHVSVYEIWYRVVRTFYYNYTKGITLLSKIYIEM
jgi:hypothetical protein